MVLKYVTPPPKDKRFGCCCDSPDFVHVFQRYRCMMVCINCDTVWEDSEVEKEHRHWFYFEPYVSAKTPLDEQDGSDDEEEEAVLSD